MSNFFNAFLIGAFTGGAIGCILMSLLTMGKIADMYSECERCEKKREVRT